jgi:hypothetical protein
MNNSPAYRSKSNQPTRFEVAGFNSNGGGFIHNPQTGLCEDSKRASP